MGGMLGFLLAVVKMGDCKHRRVAAGRMFAVVPRAAWQKLLRFAGAGKGAEGEVSEERSHRGVEQEVLVLRALFPGCAHAPGSLGKEESEEGEEDAGDLMPQHAGHMCQPPPEGLACALAGAGDGSCRCRCAGACGLCCRSVRWCGCCGVAGQGAGSGAILQTVDRGARCLAQFAAQSDIAHDRKSVAAVPQDLPWPKNGSKVGGTERAEATHTARRRRRALNSKMRNLIQQLGEAIHESVSDSEQIASVVRNIRAEGFDVLLMLEATIGLNEVTEDAPAEPDGAQESGEGAPGSGPFTAQDLHFLQSLRIRMDSDTDGDAGAEGPISGPR